MIPHLLARPAARKLLFALAAISTIAAPACKDGAGATRAPPPADSSGAPPADACATYEAKLCDAAGTESATCHAIHTTAQVMTPEACSAGLRSVSVSIAKLAEMRRPCDEVVARACEELGPQSAGCEMARAQTPQFPPERCGEMRDHLPEVVAELKEVLTSQ